MRIFAIIFISFFLCDMSFSQDKKFHRPDPQGITDFLTGKLELSPKQQEKIKKAVEKKAEEFDKINSKYSKKEAEIEKIKKEMEPMASQMETIYKSLPETVIPFLDDAQKAKFEELRKPKKKEPEVRQDEKQDEKSDTVKTGKKRILVKKKKPSVQTSEKQAEPAKTEKTSVQTKESKPKEEKKPAEEIDIFYP